MLSSNKVLKKQEENEFEMNTEEVRLFFLITELEFK